MKHIPFGSSTNAILDDLRLVDSTDFLKELLEVLSAQPSGQLLDKYSALVPLVLCRLRCRVALGRASATASVVIPAIAAVIPVTVVATRRARSRAVPAGGVVVVATSVTP